MLYFASFRDTTGRAEEVRRLPEGTRIGELWEILVREFPAFGRYRRMPGVAVNEMYQPGHVILEDGDEVAFLPPVAGG